jgi:hypothetical protein
LAIEAGPNRRVGFLSTANFNSVHTVLSKKVEPVIFTNTSGLYEAVQSGNVIAAMISGQPNASLFSVFSTDLISPRTFQMKPGADSRDLMEAVDAAVVRSHNAGELLKAQVQNPPFQAVEVHTCRIDDPTKIPFPAASNATGLLKDVLQTKRLRILAYGDANDLPNWHQDGNYQVQPHTGFWPDYMNMFMKHFQKAYGSDIILERVWMKAGGTEMVLNGTIHMTEPYYIYENLYAERLKKWSHEFGCIVLGYEQQFFAKKPVYSIVSDVAENTCSTRLEACKVKRGATQITSRPQLNAAIEAGQNRRMGFLSTANYNSVHTVLSSRVEPVIFTNTSELYKAVETGDVVAALISGQPNATRFSVFSTDLISPRTFQMKPGADSRDLMEAVDAAVVRTHNKGELLQAQALNPPFQAVEVHTCRVDDPTKIPFPAAANATGLLKDVLQTKRLRILAYGDANDKPDWQQDGNYQVEPPTGFWPTYMNMFMKHFQQAYGNDIKLERVWMTAGGTDMLLNGTIHMTEPYYIYENLHADRLKKWSHRFGCIVMGYEQQFFSEGQSALTDFSSAGSSCDMQLAACEQRVGTTNHISSVSHSGPSALVFLAALLLRSRS